MDDDFNTPVALSVLFELAKELRREENVLIHTGQPERPVAQLHALWYTLEQLTQVLGLTVEPLEVATPTGDGITDADIEVMIQQRQDARKAKNWAESDRIRDELKAQGITLIDDKSGITRWHR